MTILKLYSWINERSIELPWERTWALFLFPHFLIFPVKDLCSCWFWVDQSLFFINCVLFRLRFLHRLISLYVVIGWFWVEDVVLWWLLGVYHALLKWRILNFFKFRSLGFIILEKWRLVFFLSWNWLDFSRWYDDRVWLLTGLSWFHRWFFYCCSVVKWVVVLFFFNQLIFSIVFFLWVDFNDILDHLCSEYNMGWISVDLHLLDWIIKRFHSRLNPRLKILTRTALYR